MAKRTPGGAPTADTRAKHGFKAGGKNKTGSFPIFDRGSAISALNLRGHAADAGAVLARVAAFAKRTSDAGLQKRVDAARAADAKRGGEDRADMAEGAAIIAIGIPAPITDNPDINPGHALSRRAAAAVNCDWWYDHVGYDLGDRFREAVAEAEANGRGWAALAPEYQALMLRAEGNDGEADRIMGIARGVAAGVA